MFNIARALCVASAAMLPLAAVAQTPAPTIKITGSGGFVTDYTFRGVSQTGNKPAVQGNLEASAEVGPVTPYLGLWGSNVRFNSANLELDATGGLRGEFKGFAWDVGAIYYNYPGSDSNLNYNFWEFQAKVGYDFKVVNPSIAVNYSPDMFGKSGKAWYIQANADIPLPMDFVLSGHIGRQTVDNNVAFALPDYTDWSIGISREILGLTVSLAYVDTNITKSECGGLTTCDARAVLSVFKKF